MADNFYNVNRNIPAGFRLGRAMEALEHAMTYLNDERNTMIQMCEGGDTSSAAYFTTVTAAYGFTDNDEAKAAFAELDSLWSKLSGDGSVSGVNSAVWQALARFRN